MATGGEIFRVGIKYCGGCRAGYERPVETARVVGALNASSRYVFEHAQPGVPYDVLLLATGCATACPSLSPYTYGRAVTITKVGGGIKAAEEIRKIAESDTLVKEIIPG